MKYVVQAASLLSFLIMLQAGSLCYGERSNLVLIMVDDIGFSDIGCYGGEIQGKHPIASDHHHEHTPNKFYHA